MEVFSLADSGTDSDDDCYLMGEMYQPMVPVGTPAEPPVAQTEDQSQDGVPPSSTPTPQRANQLRQNPKPKRYLTYDRLGSPSQVNTITNNGMGQLGYVDHQNISPQRVVNGSNTMALGYNMYGAWGGPAWVGQPSVLQSFQQPVAGVGFPCGQVYPN